MFRALKYRNYRIYFYGQLISLTGTWMQQIALSWLVYNMTGSPLLLGVVGFSSQIVTFMVAPFAGVISDRHNRRHLLLMTQVAGAVQASILTTLVFTHQITVWQIIVLSLLSGLINAFDLPVRQAFTVDMIDRREDLGNAIALNSTMVNSAKLIGPAVGGLLIAVAGEGVCFLINALSYAAVIISLLVMRLKPVTVHKHTKHILQELKEGLDYTLNFLPIRDILILMAGVSLIAGGAQVLMPVFARDIFHGGARTLGFLMAASGSGALLGALYLAMRTSVLGLGKVIAAASILFGAGIIGFGISPSLGLSMLLLLCAGFGLMVQMAASNTVLQTLVEEDKRGRVMSFYTMSFMGTTPFGSLIAGALAHQMGAGRVLVAGGICAVVGTALFAMRLRRLHELARPVLIQKGILTQIVP